MVAVHVLAEGGPSPPTSGKAFRISFQKAMVTALTAAAPGLDITVEPCGGRKSARLRFEEELSKTGWSAATLESHAAASDRYPLLLVDSERPVAQASTNAWLHLAAGRPAWQRPTGADDEQACLMVEAMEAWFIADPLLPQAYFGHGYNGARLPNVAASAIPKGQLNIALRAASRPSAKTAYEKGRDSPDLLTQVDLAGVVGQQCPWAARLVAHLQLLAATP